MKNKKFPISTFIKFPQHFLNICKTHFYFYTFSYTTWHPWLPPWYYISVNLSTSLSHALENARFLFFSHSPFDSFSYFKLHVISTLFSILFFCICKQSCTTYPNESLENISSEYGVTLLTNNSSNNDCIDRVTQQNREENCISQ